MKNNEILMVLNLRPGRVQKRERTIGADLKLRENCAKAGTELGPGGRRKCDWGSSEWIMLLKPEQRPPDGGVV